MPLNRPLTTAPTQYWHADHRADVITVTPTRRGWSGRYESRLFGSGVRLGRSHITNTTLAANEHTVAEPSHLGLHIVLSAAYSLDFTHLGQALNIQANQLWLRRGNLGDVIGTWYATGTTRLLTLDFSQEVYERWREAFPIPKWLQSDDNSQPLAAHHQLMRQRHLLLRAKHILDHPAATLSDILALEGLTLGLCSALFALSPVKHSSKIDDAIDIIRSEYHLPLTITHLAQRVGLNECYLKQHFKARTGRTVAAFIRELRMQEALRLLLDEQRTLQEVAHYVGYRDAKHFAKLLYKTHGLDTADLPAHD